MTLFGHLRRAERGQILVIVAAGMLVFIAMVALVIDGGYAWGHQRDTQNGSDAAAHAGAVLLAENLPFGAANQPLPNTDADVLAAVEAMAGTNNVEVEGAVYTDFHGTELGVAVGSLGNVPPPAGANGVKVTGRKDFDTLLAGVMGFQELTARTDATAVAGYVIEMPREGVLPVTIPVTVPHCDAQNNLVHSTAAWVPGEPYTLYLCSSGPGNVGWLDWTPPHGGTSELAQAILNPSNDPMAIPDWYYVSQTGNVNSIQVENALKTWIGKGPVNIPLFDATCNSYPGGPDSPCTTGAGTGQNQWYHFKNWIAFEITSVHITGSNAACDASNGSTGCIKGVFRNMFGPGTLAEPLGGENPLAVVGVQLID